MPIPQVNTEHFQEQEFYCKCAKCKGIARIPDKYLGNLKRLVNKLETARLIARIPFHITSGYRCLSHPESIKKPKSAHTTAEAADIEVNNDSERYLILLGLNEASFIRLGIAKGFVHGDCSEKLPQSVLWVY